MKPGRPYALERARPPGRHCVGCFPALSPPVSTACARSREPGNDFRREEFQGRGVLKIVVEDEKVHSGVDELT